MTDDEIIVRKTVIGGKRWRDDYTVICVHATTRPAFNSCGRYIVPGVCTKNSIRVDEVMESPKLAE